MKNIKHIALRAIAAFLVMTATVVLTQWGLRQVIPGWETKLADLGRTEAEGLVLVVFAMLLTAVIPANLVASICLKKLLPVTSSMREEKSGWHLFVTCFVMVVGVVLFSYSWSKSFDGMSIEVLEGMFGGALAMPISLFWALEAHTNNQEAR